MFIYQLIFYFLELCKYAVLFTSAFDFKWRKKRYVIPFDVVLLMGTSIYYTWWEYYWSPMLVYVLFIVLFLVNTYQNIGKLYRFFAITAWSIFTITLFDSIAYMMLPFKDDNVNGMCSSCITLLFLLICFGLIKMKNYNIFQNISWGYYLAFSLVGFVNQTVLSILYVGAEKKSQYIWLFVVAAIGVFFQMATVLLLAVSNNIRKEKEQMNQEFLRAQEMQYLYLEKKEEETRKFRHDIRGHLHVLNELMNQGDVIGFHQYMEKVFGVIEPKDSYISIGNSIVDAILNQYLELFQNENILLEVKGHMPSDCFIEAYDLCVIFSNMLKNAFEAVQNSDNRIISLLLRYDECAIYIQQENSYTDIQLENNKLITTKKEKSKHGYGIKNIQGSVQKYGGIVNCLIENQCFCMTIYIERPMV